MKVGDLVMLKKSKNNLTKRRTDRSLENVGIIIKITKSDSIFVYWPKRGYKSGYNLYNIHDRLEVISEAG